MQFHDVRTEAEVKEGALRNAKNIVYDDSFSEKLSEVSLRKHPYLSIVQLASVAQKPQRF